MAPSDPDRPRVPVTGLRPPWSRSDRGVARVLLRPLQSFLDLEAASGILILAATLIALLWANSPWRASYEMLWHTVLTFRLGDFVVSADLGHWVDDGLMALFFLVVGLEVKRELTTGELRDPRAAALPVVAAIGGMVVPALLYLALNAGAPGARGWAVPMATDIAFALGVLTIAGSRVPPGLKLFLLTLAIVDDIGAIVVIAVFYAGGVAWAPFAIAVAICLVIVGLRAIHVRAMAVYVLLGAGLWLATLRSGIHPTIAGAVLGLLTPAVPFQRPAAVSAEAHRIADETVDEPEPPDADAPEWMRLAWISREAVSPLARVEAALHPWTSYVIVPLFALANAGVHLSRSLVADAVGSRITFGIVIGLVIGKPVGISLASFAAVKSRLARLPDGIGWSHIAAAGVVAGIGFTVSLFIAELAFRGRAAEVAKVDILMASILAGILGYVAVRVAGRRRSKP